MFVDVLAHVYRAPQRMRRLYCLALTATAGVAAIMLAMLCFDHLQGSYTRLQDRRATLGNMLRIVAAGRESEGAALAVEQASRSVFLQGSSTAVVSASLQSWLGATVQEAGAQLQSIENSALPEAEARSYVGLSANVAGPWKAVQSVIFRIETAEPALTIRSLELQSYAYGAPGEMEPNVTMQISIRGAISDIGS